MSRQHPIIAVTGSSGAGTTTVKRAFEHIFRRESITPVIIEGDSFHAYNRKEFRIAVKEAEKRGNHAFSHFGPEANHFDKLEHLFRSYGESGLGERRFYLHDCVEAQEKSRELGGKFQAGEFTPWFAATNQSAPRAKTSAGRSTGGAEPALTTLPCAARASVSPRTDLASVPRCSRITRSVL